MHVGAPLPHSLDEMGVDRLDRRPTGRGRCRTRWASIGTSGEAVRRRASNNSANAARNRNADEGRKRRPAINGSAFQ
jgi:hypothetical protein